MQREEISELAGILRREGDKILDSSSKLSLSASILGKLNQTFSTVTPADDILNDFIELGFLYDFVQQTLALKLFPDHEIFNSLLDISLFGRLKLLEVHRLSLNLITGLKNLRSQLEYMTCMRSVSELKDVLESCGADRTEGYVWCELKEAVFSHNNINTVTSLEFAPRLQSLDLSYNNIRNIEALNCLLNLKYLNLGNNRIESLPDFKGSLCSNLQILILRNNYIEEFKEVTSLINLEELDLSDNCLFELVNLLPLSNLFQLRMLNLRNNPLNYQGSYRVRISCYLNENVRFRSFLLDGVALSKKELRVIGSIEPPALNFQRCESFNSTTTASTVVPVRRVDVNQTSDMEISSSSVEISQVPIKSISTTLRNSSFHEQGMQDSGFEAELRPVSPTNSIVDPIRNTQTRTKSPENSRSATSLQTETDVEHTLRYSESDIEILSNPSQSSIEVLSTNVQTARCVRSCVILPHVLKELCTDADLSKLTDELHKSL